MSELLSVHDGLVTEVGSRIFALRTGRGWSQADLAGRLGMPRSRISKWEIGMQAPQLAELFAMSQVFRVSLDELVTGRRD
ncbi:MAG TPA: helix-turn-helix transcriptional regulator [Thermoanaerobaculia bacterium]|nr:helix-turn-helix transcriptional regulator [Thermoanaerobaculia bacterium]